jgi:hypothetical protein
MKTPNVELKGIKTFRGNEGYGFNATIYVNGVKCMFVIDDANGGCYNYESFIYKNSNADLVKENIKLLNEYIKTLPEQPMVFDGKPYKKDGKIVMLKPDMDSFIDEILNKELIKKEKEKLLKKMLKLQNTSIIYGIPNSEQFSYIQWNKPLKDLPIQILQNKITDIVNKFCKNGIVILNTNLNELNLIY